MVLAALMSCSIIFISSECLRICKATLGGKDLFGLQFHNTVHHCRKSGLELKQGRNLEAGADAKVKEGSCLLP